MSSSRDHNTLSYPVKRDGRKKGVRLKGQNVSKCSYLQEDVFSFTMKTGLKQRMSGCFNITLNIKILFSTRVKRLQIQPAKRKLEPAGSFLPFWLG